MKYLVPKKEGKPLRWTPEQLQKKIDKYFSTTQFMKWTISGLCLHLDCTKQLLTDYQKRKDTEHIVNQAKLKVEHSYEMAMRTSEVNNAGNIFALKNFGWTDKYEVDHGLSDSYFEKYKDLTDGELQTRFNSLCGRN